MGHSFASDKMKSCGDTYRSFQKKTDSPEQSHNVICLVHMLHFIDLLNNESNNGWDIFLKSNVYVLISKRMAFSLRRWMIPELEPQVTSCLLVHECYPENLKGLTCIPSTQSFLLLLLRKVASKVLQRRNKFRKYPATRYLLWFLHVICDREFMTELSVLLISHVKLK